MGIDISQWRAAIGRFRHYGIKKDFCSNSEQQQEHFDVRHFLHFFTLLIVLGSIESNPGPRNEDYQLPSVSN